jgi:hypothetical protein
MTVAQAFQYFETTVYDSFVFRVIEFLRNDLQSLATGRFVAFRQKLKQACRHCIDFDETDLIVQVAIDQ